MYIKLYTHPRQLLVLTLQRRTGNEETNGASVTPSRDNKKAEKGIQAPQ